MKHNPDKNGGRVSTEWKKICERPELWDKARSEFTSLGAEGLSGIYHCDKKCDTVRLRLQIKMIYDEHASRKEHKNRVTY